MLNLQIFGPKSPPVFAKMIQEGGQIRVILVDSEEVPLPRGNLFGINKEGRLIRYGSINEEAAKNAGLQLDSSGKIISISE